jgi:aerobic carbon-monoxide dehydrogenase medium subunit
LNNNFIWILQPSIHHRISKGAKKSQRSFAPFVSLLSFLKRQFSTYLERIAMKPAPFDYFAPDSLEEALDLLAQYGYDAKLLAGGQSLIPAMNFRLTQPAVLVDLNRLQTLDSIEPGNGGGLRLGAMTRQRTVERDPRVAKRAPLLAEAMPQIAHPQIRNRGTIGGSIVHADPAAELPVVAVALDARFQVRGPNGTRWIAAADFFQGTFAIDLAPDEILLAVEFPPWPARSGWSFMEVARRQGDYALVGAAAVVTLDENGRCQQARLVYLNVGEKPVDAHAAASLLTGETITPEIIEAAANTAADSEIDPGGNIHASVSYQRHLTRVLTRRALATALTRAQN